MMKKINKVQNETIKAVQKKLKEHHRCLLVRPTSFGKTKMAVDIMKKYKHAVFLYPTKNIEDAVAEHDTHNINLELYTYSKLRNLYKSPDNFIKTFSHLNSKNTIFVFDEAHFIAAVKTSEAVLHLMNEVCPNANFLGLTATPNRTDRVEIKWHYFNGNTVYEYGLKDCFNDGIFLKPHYIYTPLQTDDLIEHFTRRIDNLPVSKNKKDQLKSRVQKSINPEKLNIENIDDIILNNLHKFKSDINYYKFILFFSTFKNIHAKKDEIISSFQRVFPQCEINVVIVTSESHKYSKNRKTLYNLKARENTIDLIFTINMITHGHHTPDITGIMMFRQTVSNIIYVQQVGRCLSAFGNRRAIIFDFVENLYKDIPSSVTNHNRLYKESSINRIDLLMSEDDIILDDKSKEITDISRLIDNAITEEFEVEIVRKYLSGILKDDIDYCITKLQLHDEEDFMKVVERYT